MTSIIGKVLTAFNEECERLHEIGRKKEVLKKRDWLAKHFGGDGYDQYCQRLQQVAKNKPLARFISKSNGDDVFEPYPREEWECAVIGMPRRFRPAWNDLKA